jgi:hypothetical protein
MGPHRKTLAAALQEPARQREKKQALALEQETPRLKSQRRPWYREE